MDKTNLPLSLEILLFNIRMEEKVIVHDIDSDKILIGNEEELRISAKHLLAYNVTSIFMNHESQMIQINVSNEI